MTETRSPPKSAVDFSDMSRREAVARIGIDRKCSYLMALAAWQRGLTVEFFGNQVDARVNIETMPAEAAQPKLFTITDGKRRHFFFYSMGDATTATNARVASSKDLAKRRFVHGGVRTPPSRLWLGDNAGEIKSFLARFPNKTFVIKPEIGSLRVGVQTRVPAAQVIVKLAQIGAKSTLVEQNIEGVEHRVYVVGGQVIAAHIKPGTFVIGNGRDTISQLIQRKNAARMADPVLNTCLIDLAGADQYLAEFGKTAARIPVLGERVVVHASNNMSHGGDGYSVTETLDADVARMAIAACAALDLPNGAVDIILFEGLAYVLEVNVVAGLIGHSFPTVGQGSGNAVSEAIVDWYFPLPDGSTPVRHTEMLDCTDLVAAFAKHGTRTRFKIPLLDPQMLDPRRF